MSGSVGICLIIGTLGFVAVIGSLIALWIDRPEYTCGYHMFLSGQRAILSSTRCHRCRREDFGTAYRMVMKWFV